MPDAFRKTLAALGGWGLQQAGKTQFLCLAQDMKRLSRNGQHASRETTRQERLAHLLNGAITTPFHQERLSGVGLPITDVHPQDAFSVLQQLKPVRKTDIRKRFPEGVVTVDRGDNRSYLSTSGTTGERFTVVSNFFKRDVVRALVLHTMHVSTGEQYGFRMVDIPPNACNTVCGLDGPPITSWYELIKQGASRKSFKSTKFKSDLHGMFQRRILFVEDVLAPIDARNQGDLVLQLSDLWTTLSRLHPKLLRAFPQYLLWLAESQPDRLRYGDDAKGYCAPYGGLACPQMLQRVGRSLSMHTRNMYGTSEVGPIAAACNNQHSMHIFEDWFIVEIMRDDQPVQDGEIGEIAITDLSNTAMPLIRYYVGDVGRIVGRACECGSDTQKVEVLGRIHETITQREQWVTAAQIGDAAYIDDGVSNFRVDEVSKNHFELQIVPSLLGIEPDMDSIHDRFTQLFQEPVRARCRKVAFLPPESTGKFLTCRLKPASTNVRVLA
jgi:phenylacetate-CoA ligase